MLSLSPTSFSTLILLLLSSIATTWASGSGSDWDYDDTDAWCGDKHWYCCPQYTTQSPININTLNGLKRKCPVSGGLDWVLGTTTSFTMKNTGHSLQVTPHGDDQGELKIGNKKYCLEQFHVHWGEIDLKGSEHTINDVSASLEIHFVHYLCDLGDVSSAIAAAETLSGHDAYTLAVVSALYIDDTSFSHYESPLLNLLINRASSVQSATSEFTVDTSNLRMTELVRDTISSDPVYFYYKGSLTTPGCNHIVHWNVLRDPMYVSTGLLSTLRSSLQNEKSEVITKNYRKTQPNTNPVYLCGDHEESHSGDDSDNGDVHHHHFESSDSS